MLMKTRAEPVDFHAVDDHHAAINKRLENWARYVEVRGASWMSPIWKLGKSHGRQWHAPNIRPPVDELDGHRVEKAIRTLPRKQCEAIRWAYVYKGAPARKARELAVSYEGLMDLLRTGRTMLKNTCAQNETHAIQLRAIDRADA